MAHETAAAWRPMIVEDLDSVVRIAAIAFPNHFEDRACFASRLAVYPAGCRVLADGEAIVGYIVAYPWRANAAPPLNAVIEAIPPDAGLMYLHDLALHPAARGGGYATLAVERLAETSRGAGWPAIALVAVNDAAAFWERHGFSVRQPPGMAEKLATYGADARYMVRLI